ncbi:MAG: RecB family exonuclease [Phycisphaeraceae bacterium]
MIQLPQVQPTSNGKVVTPNEIARGVTGRPHMSYSEVKTFQRCPLKWRYQYVDRASYEQTSAALLLGIGIHASIELYFHSVFAADMLPSLDELLLAFDAAWGEQSGDVPVVYARGQDKVSLREQARAMLGVFLASEHATPPGRLIGLEESFQVRLDPALPDLAGRIDMISYDEEGGRLLITDYKTSRSVWSRANAEEQATQLRLYARGCEQMARDLGAGLALRFIVITKTKSPKIEAIDINATHGPIDREIDVLKRVFAAMQSGVVYPAPSPLNCSGCPFAKRCEEWPSSEK